MYAGASLSYICYIAKGLVIPLFTKLEKGVSPLRRFT